jgi:RimJ/RimL family protein N-acetyltransferase
MKWNKKVKQRKRNSCFSNLILSFMNLETKRLFLRETDWSDLPVIHALFCEPQVEQFTSVGLPGKPEVTRAIISGPIEDQTNIHRTQYEWIISLKKSEHVVGLTGISLGPDRFRSAEVHYNLFPNYWGNGYAYESLNEVIRFCFYQLKLHRIWAGVAINNHRSIRLLEKLGMTREGRGREIIPAGGEWIDNYQYAILENEF